MTPCSNLDQMIRCLKKYTLKTLGSQSLLSSTGRVILKQNSPNARESSNSSVQKSFYFYLPSLKTFTQNHFSVVSILLYGSPAGSPSVTYLIKLEKLKNLVFKRICFDKNYTSALLSHSYLPLCFHFKRNDLILLWK